MWIVRHVDSQFSRKTFDHIAGDEVIESIAS